MAQPLTASMPPDMQLDGNYTIRLTALDPSTGAVVPGVNISSVTMLVNDLTGGAGTGLDYGEFKLVPGPGA